MRAFWGFVYVLASVWIIGLVLGLTGSPVTRFLVSPQGPPSASQDRSAAPTEAKPPSQPIVAGAATARAAIGEKGLQPLQARVEGAVKVFDLEAAPIRWEVAPGELEDAWAYNGQVPGPLIRVSEGDRVRINLKNGLPERTTIYIHGPNLASSNGPPDGSPLIAEPGQSLSYEFTASPAGTFVYHPHHTTALQELKGLSGVFIIDPKGVDPKSPQVYVGSPKEGQLQAYDREYVEVVGELGSKYFINGKSYPATEPLLAKPGERVLIRLINLGQQYHPMHLHGYHFSVVGTDGYAVQGAPLIKDTLNIAPGERYDIAVDTQAPGTWMFHCHLLTHVTNQAGEPAGMLTSLKIQ